MREIKFRAWDKKENRMFNVVAISFECEELIEANEIDSIVHDFKDCIIMQYTGLKDCKGNEIYEGDIVRNYFGVKCIEDTEENRKYEDKPIIRDVRDIRCLESAKLYEGMDMLDVEIIGNVYEHGHLLNGK